MATPRGHSPRHALIRGALAGLARGWASDSATALQKMSHEQAQYQDPPNGWCKLFEMMD
jgi:hypothetical protein